MIDLKILGARKTRYQQQLADLEKFAGPLTLEQTQKQAELEKEITATEGQEAEKRKSIKQFEEESIARIQDLALATTLEKIKIDGAARNEAQRHINANVLAAEKKGRSDELKTLTDEEAQGKILDTKELARKQQLQIELTKLDAEGVEARKQLALQDAQATTDATQTIADNLTSIFPQIKAFAIAATLISTYSAAQKAYEAEVGVPVVGPALALAAAATAIALGLAKVGAIAQITGFGEGGVATKPTIAMVGEAGTEIMAPEKDFIQVFKDDFGPKLIDVLAPQIKASVLQNASVAANGQISGPGAINITVTMEVAQFVGTREFFERIIKPAVEDAMRSAGTKTADSLYKNRKYL